MEPPGTLPTVFAALEGDASLAAGGVDRDPWFSLCRRPSTLADFGFYQAPGIWRAA
jgi:hypothetical protein